MAKKQAGLNKKVSSIFSGIPNLEEQVAQPGQRPQTSPNFLKQTSAGKMPSVETLLGDAGAFRKRAKLLFEIGASKIKAALLVAEAGDW